MTNKDLKDIQLEAQIKDHDVAEILDILENMDDEILATQLLKDFNSLSRTSSQLIQNRSEYKNKAEEWQQKWEETQKQLVILVDRILQQK